MWQKMGSVLQQKLQLCKTGTAQGSMGGFGVLGEGKRVGDSHLQGDNDVSGHLQGHGGRGAQALGQTRQQHTAGITAGRRTQGLKHLQTLFFGQNNRQS